MDTNSKKKLPAWLPFVVGAFLVVQFAGLGVWQISRGLEKRANRDAFDTQTHITNYHDGAELRPYQPLKAAGYFDSEHQILLDNIILNSRYGYYVLTALELADDVPLLIVNRGWIEKTAQAATSVTIAVPEGRLTVRGRVGALPRPGYRMGDAFAANNGWPQIAVFPRTEDLEQSLGRKIQPFILLMDPDDEHGFLRHWVPEGMGPAKHFGYALQWFAMGIVLAGLLLWNFRKHRSAANE